MKKQPFIIAFEGHDGVGKTTQSILLHAKLNSRGFKCKRTKTPVGAGTFVCSLTEKLIKLIVKTDIALVFPNTFNFLHFINKSAAQNNIINDDVDVIIFDRWKLSAIVYGEAVGGKRRFNERLCSNLIEPDVTIILSADRRRIDGDCIDMNDNIQNFVKRMYTNHAYIICKKNVVVIDSNADTLSVHERVFDAIMSCYAGEKLQTVGA